VHSTQKKEAHEFFVRGVVKKKNTYDAAGVLVGKDLL
jgi:hypothetical protein